MKNASFALMTMAMIALAVPANAEECFPVTSTPEVDTGDTGIDTDGDGTTDRFYVDNDVCQLDGCGFSIWVYQESNGMDGLQRNDEFSGDLACGNGDTIIF